MTSTKPVKTPDFAASDILAPAFWSGRVEKAGPGVDVACTKISVDLQNLTRETAEAVLKRSLEALRDLELDWSLSVSEFLEVPFLVMQTDLLGFVARSMISPASDAAGLIVIDPGLPPLDVPISLIWHETRRADPGHRWLRERVAEDIAHAAKA